MPSKSMRNRRGNEQEDNDQNRDIPLEIPPRPKTLVLKNGTLFLLKIPGNERPQDDPKTSNLRLQSDESSLVRGGRAFIHNRNMINTLYTRCLDIIKGFLAETRES